MTDIASRVEDLRAEASRIAETHDERDRSERFRGAGGRTNHTCRGRTGGMVSSYRCRGCHALLQTARDLTKLEGTTRPSWRCRQCGVTVPGVVAERLKHQKQHEVRRGDDRIE